MNRSILALTLMLALPAAASAQGAAVPVSYRASAPMKFTIRVENVSTPATLKLSSGETAPAPHSPVFWMIHNRSDVLFTDGKMDRGDGLEQLAEGGNPGVLVKKLMSMGGVLSIGAATKPVGDLLDGPALPGKAFEFTVMAEQGQKLTIATMFGQSNDLFYAPTGRGIDLFDAAGMPMSGDITAQIQLWDAGTEVNEEPGLGPNQGPRQKGADAGAKESKAVALVRDSFKYPRVGEVLRVTVTPKGSSN